MTPAQIGGTSPIIDDIIPEIKDDFLFQAAKCRVSVPAAEKEIMM
jgi:hypothetical protein